MDEDKATHFNMIVKLTKDITNPSLWELQLFLGSVSTAKKVAAGDRGK